MNLVTRKLHSFLGKVWVVLALAIAAIFSALTHVRCTVTCAPLHPGETSHFFSADLVKDEANSCRNERPNWEQFYRTAIVVPIRFIDRHKVGQPEVSDHIGFLAVDA